MGARSTMTDDEKREAVARVVTGNEKAKDVADELGVSTNALRLWRQRFAATVEEAPQASTKKKSAKKAPGKKKPARREKAAPEPTSTLLQAHHVNDEWNLPHPLGELVVCAEILRDWDDFDALERLERAVAAHRELMERRAA